MITTTYGGAQFNIGLNIKDAPGIEVATYEKIALRYSLIIKFGDHFIQAGFDEAYMRQHGHELVRQLADASEKLLSLYHDLLSKPDCTK